MKRKSNAWHRTCSSFWYKLICSVTWYVFSPPVGDWFFSALAPVHCDNKPWNLAKSDSGSPNQPGLVSLYLTFQLLETSTPPSQSFKKNMVWITTGDPHARIFWILHLQMKQAMGDHPCLHWNLQANGTHPFLSVEWIPDKSVIQAIPDCLHPPQKDAGFLWNMFYLGNIFPPGNPAAWHLRNLKKHPFTTPGGLLPSWGLHGLA